MTYIPDTATWFDRGDLFKAARNADETEFAAMLEGTVPLERGIRDDIVADEHHADIEDHNYTWQDEESALDFISGPLIEEIDRRSAILGDKYPFRRINSSLHYVASETLVYEFCLSVSLLKNLTSKPFNKFPLVFEYIASEAARCYLGEAARSIRTGWPPHERAMRPTKFSDMLALLSSETAGEFRWAPYMDLPPKWKENAPKDEGLDFVAWKPFGDKRLGPLFVLGQCACGDDWENKLNDLEEERLKRWMNPVTYVKFVRAFAVPHHIPGHFVFADVSRRAGLTFDRARLTILAHENRAAFSGGHKEMIEAVISHSFPANYA